MTRSHAGRRNGGPGPHRAQRRRDLSHAGQAVDPGTYRGVLRGTRAGAVIPRSGRPRRGPGVQRPGRRPSVRLTSGRQRGDHHRTGHLTSGRRRADRRRMNHGGQAGHFVRCRHPGMRRRGHARQAVVAGRHLRPGRRNGARVLPRAGHRRAGRRCAGGRHGSHRCASCRSAGHPHGGHRRAGRRCAGGRHGSHRCAGRRCGDWPQSADQQAGNRSPGDCRRGRGHERDGRCSRRRSRATLPGRPGRCRCGRNPACSPVSHPMGYPGPDGCHSSCLHPDCWAAGPSFQCPRCRHPGFRRRCFGHHRTGLRSHYWRVPDRYSRRDPAQHRCWNGPDRGRHPPSGSGPAPCHQYGSGRPDPARLPRSCSALS